jgi:error-prone DNA polymerase
MRSPIPAYAELHCLSNFSFLRGASRPEELVERAKALGYSALALTDECSMAGVVRAHVAAKEHGLPLILGAQFEVADAPLTLIVLAQTLDGYGNLCDFITGLRRASPKGTYRLLLDAVDATALDDCLVLAAPKRDATPAQLLSVGRWLLGNFSGRCWIAVHLLRLLDDEMWLHRARQLSRLTEVPLVAAGDVHLHVRSRKALQDVLTATRIGKPLTECGLELQPNAERHLRTRLRLAQTYPPELLAETLRVAERCRFTLDELRYQYPAEVIPAGASATSHLRRLTYEGGGRRWPQGMPAKVQQQIEHELALIAELKYEHYFLTVADIVGFARSRHILCQGRGSAANSVVCYCLGITEVDPARMSVLFERFISRERNEPPDIDVDFEHERREEVIQYLYEKYGRHRAGLTAAVISYRPRSAIRDVGKALGFDLETVDRIAKSHMWFDGRQALPERLQEAGLSPDDLAVQQLLKLTGELLGFPRHLSQHVGGFVLTAGPLSRMVPIENAAMADRTVIEWDKDDLDALGLLKVDVLALGMLTAIRKSLEFIGVRKGYRFEMQDIPAEDPATYDMVCRADTVGVFQIESRAQQSMLPRMKPRCFYDLVIEVAIVRPGPIQGGMVHPYLNRRQGKEPVEYPSEALKEALGRTLGVPVFQEQVMQVAILAAGFTPGEADQLRRAMAAWKRKGGLDKYYGRIVEGMTSRGYSREFAEQIFSQIHGFSEYGFPESHAASFALLVYASCWIKRHHPAEFLAAMLNSQPLGFYTPSQLVQDAKKHGVQVRPVDVMYSDYDCTLEDLPAPPAVRLGLRHLAGLREDAARRIVEARATAPFDDAEDLARRGGLEQHEMKLLAAGDALASLSGHRRQQVWEAAALKRAPVLLRDAPVDEPFLELPAAPEGEEIVWDYASTGLTLRRHPLALLRPRLREQRLMTAAELDQTPNGRLVRACGIVTIRQQPETANGTTFLSLEDETGAVQVVCWRRVRERQRAVLLQARLLAVYGTWQREGEVRNLIAGHLVDLSHLLGRLVTSSRDFR